MRCVNALSGLYLIVTDEDDFDADTDDDVSMPSRAYTSLLRDVDSLNTLLGFVEVSMPSRAYTSLLRGTSL